MILGDKEIGLIHSWLWDGLEDAQKEGRMDFQGMSVNVGSTELGKAPDLGLDGTEVILIRLFWGHGSNHTGQDISGRYVVTRFQYEHTPEEGRAHAFRYIGKSMGMDVIRLFHGEPHRVI